MWIESRNVRKSIFTFVDMKCFRFVFLCCCTIRYNAATDKIRKYLSDWRGCSVTALGKTVIGSMENQYRCIAADLFEEYFGTEHFTRCRLQFVAWQCVAAISTNKLVQLSRSCYRAITFLHFVRFFTSIFLWNIIDKCMPSAIQIEQIFDRNSMASEWNTVHILICSTSLSEVRHRHKWSSAVSLFQSKHPWKNRVNIAFQFESNRCKNIAISGANVISTQTKHFQWFFGLILYAGKSQLIFRSVGSSRFESGFTKYFQ